MTVVMANFFFYVLIYLGPTTGKRLMITLWEHMLLLCVGVTTECDPRNSDVETEQPLILIYRVPNTIRYVLKVFFKTTHER